MEIDKSLAYSQRDTRLSVTNVIMGIFERLDYNNEMSAPINSHITSDQHAYRQGQSTTTALLKCQKLLVKMT